MRARVAVRGIAFGSLAGLGVAPLSVICVQAAIGSVHALEVFGGALFAVVFFASTSVTAAIFQNNGALAKAVMSAYAIKTSVVFAFLYFVSLNSLSSQTLAISISLSAFSYLAVQTVVIAGRARL